MKTFCISLLVVLLAASLSLGASLGGSGCTGQIFDCFVNPCMVSHCSYQGAHCIADYCGGCNTVWYDGHTKLTAEQCGTAAAL